MTYIANKPIRFDRNYHIGENIPETVIEPMMAKKLIEMGKIICVTLPSDDGTEAASSSEEQPTDDAESADETNTQEVTENTADGQNEATENGTEAAEAVNNVETDSDSTNAKDSVAEETHEFKCDVCGKRFGSANALAAHSRVHKQ